MVVVHLTPGGTSAGLAAPEEGGVDQIGNTTRIDADQAEAPKQEPPRNEEVLDEAIGLRSQPK